MLLSSILKKFTDMSLCKSNSALMHFKRLTQLPKVTTVSLNNKISISSNKFHIINSDPDVVLNAKKSIIYFRVPVTLKEKNFKSRTSDSKLTEENEDTVECDDRFRHYEVLQRKDFVQAGKCIKEQQNKLIVVKNAEKDRHFGGEVERREEERQIQEVLVLDEKIKELIKRNRVTEAVIPTSRLNKRFAGRRIVKENEKKPIAERSFMIVLETSMKEYKESLSELMLNTKNSFRLVEKSVEEQVIRATKDLNNSMINQSNVEANKELVDWKVAEKYTHFTIHLHPNVDTVKTELQNSLQLQLIKTASLENEIRKKASLVVQKLLENSKIGNFLKSKEYFVPPMEKKHFKEEFLGGSNSKSSGNNVQGPKGVKGIKFLSLMDLCKRRTTDPSLYYKDVCGKLQCKTRGPKAQKLMNNEKLQNEIQEKNTKVTSNLSSLKQSNENPKQVCDSQQKEESSVDEKPCEVVEEPCETSNEQSCESSECDEPQIEEYDIVKELPSAFPTAACQTQSKHIEYDKYSYYEILQYLQNCRIKDPSDKNKEEPKC